MPRCKDPIKELERVEKIRIGNLGRKHLQETKVGHTMPTSRPIYAGGQP